jgi:hypothetical protein
MEVKGRPKKKIMFQRSAVAEKYKAKAFYLNCVQKA